ncbi:MAG: hypothetical protein JWP03_320, partial [Phycisphaerales bacterium]|nr:hypothetical protein [Phycisphaerales bacterium]
MTLGPVSRKLSTKIAKVATATLLCCAGARAGVSPLSLDETPPPRQAEQPDTASPAEKKEFTLFHPTPR